LDKFKHEVKTDDRVVLTNVAKTALNTKLAAEMANQMVDMVVDAVLSIK